MLDYRSNWRWVAACAVLIAAWSVSASALDLAAAFPDNQGGNLLYAQYYDAGTFTNMLDAGTKYFSKTGSTSGFPILQGRAADILFHPGAGPWAVLEYSPGAAGQYSYVLNFTNGGGGAGCTTTASVFVNNLVGSPLKQGDVSIANNSGNPLVLSGSVVLGATDVLRIAIDPKYAATGYSYDGVLATGQITMATPVPEPGSLIALGFGLAGTLSAILRQRKIRK
jgi:hypothetical protein